MSLFQWADLGEFPLVSCIMPTFGRPKLVPESVAMFLEQDYPHKELIILNDCPGQTYVSDLPGVRVINANERYQSLGTKRNEAIKLAKGPLIAVWDDDDVYLPWRLSYTVEQMRILQTPHYRPYEFWAYWGKDELLTNRSLPEWVSHGLAMFQKSLWEAVEGYPEITLGEDSAFFRRIETASQVELSTYEISVEDRFFILRGSSPYAHTSIGGGHAPPETTPGRIVLEPRPIQDELLNRLASRLIHQRTNKSGSGETPANSRNSEKQVYAQAAVRDPMNATKSLFWYRDSNFGDALNKVFLPEFGVPVRWAPPEEADIIGIGSILDRIPSAYTGMILGAGFISAQNERTLSHADIRIVRGRYSAERCSAPGTTCLGDPGLLVERFLTEPQEPGYSLGLIPHYVDKLHPGVLKLAERYPGEILLIDIRGTTQQVLREISSCAAIASSSLHGLIAADALGKPNLWLKLSDQICGGTFKYRDYYSAFLPDAKIRNPIDLTGGESLGELLQEAVEPGNEVEDVKFRLAEVFANLFNRDRAGARTNEE